MQKILFILFFGIYTHLAHADNLCGALFAKTEILTPDDVASDIIAETAIIENKLSTSEVEHLVELARTVLKDKKIDAQKIYEILYVAKKKYDAEIDQQLSDLGHRLNKSVRDMRNRRQRFALALKQGDSLRAAHIYRDLYESYYVALSFLKSYVESSSPDRERILVEQSRYSLIGLAQSDLLRDFKARIQTLSTEKRSSASDVLDVLDQILARTNDEFRYAEWYMQKLETDPQTSEQIKEGLKYVRSRLNVDALSERFKLPLLKQSELSAATTAQLVRSRPQVLVYWLRYVRDAEKKYSRRLKMRSFLHVENFRTLINLIPEKYRGPISKMVGLDYNTYVIDVHFEALEAVILSPAGKARLEAFQEGVADGDKAKSEQFMETLARLSADMDVWSDIKTQVETLAKTQGNYAALLKMMTAAETKISVLGFISRLEETSFFDHYVGWILPGLFTGGTAAYYNWDTLVSWYHFSISYAVQHWPF